MAQQARIHINRPVFFTSGALILALVLFAVLAPARAQRLFGALQDWIFSNASWFYMLAVATILVTMVLVAFSRYGDIKLGPTTASRTTATPPGTPCCLPPAWA